ncbi:MULTISPECIES: hypothetical protein [Uliginosibacterium]|uniref:Uncharacterized protein n=1 Tax=Uliginosibacterium aquaticum TaxID=2731212 RepID=A0ABX2IGS0_9RHOO|nr:MULTISPECIES: hypothetical protein [Uliginosibacterium]NSL55938.1 hypothetical protein [Uliginosibacterium aquaticum]
MNIIIRCLVACVACFGFMVATSLSQSRAPQVPSAAAEPAPASPVVAVIPHTRSVE